MALFGPSNAIKQGSPWAVGLALTLDGQAVDLTTGTTSGEVRVAADPQSERLAVLTITPVSASPGRIVAGLSAYKTSLFERYKYVYVEIDFTPTADPLNPRRVILEKVSVSQGGNLTTDELDEHAPDPTTAIAWFTVAAEGAQGNAVDQSARNSAANAQATADETAAALLFLASGEVTLDCGSPSAPTKCVVDCGAPDSETTFVIDGGSP